MPSSSGSSQPTEVPWIQRFLDRKRAEVERISPDRIYVENVRAFFGLPTKLARLLLDTAVFDGALERRVGVRCPADGHIIRSFRDGEILPESLPCTVCREFGRVDHAHRVGDCEVEVFYRRRGRGDP